MPVSVLAFVRISAFNAENSVDAYYHIAIADQGPQVYMAKEFPALTSSSWTKAYCDKELAYHLILSCIRRFGFLAGLSPAPPFQLVNIVFLLLFALTFSYCLHYYGTAVADLKYYCLTAVIISPFFTDRILMIRPHNLSIILILLSCPVFDSICKRQQLYRAFLIGGIFAWSYSNPHFLLLPAAVYGIMKTRRDLLLGLMLPLLTVCGLAAGYILHPQFPNTFVNWKIQCCDVLMQAVFADLQIAIGNEFQRPGIIWLIRNSLPLIIYVFNICLMINLRKKYFADCRLRDWLQATPASWALLMIASTAVCGVFWGIRAMEYACPFVLLHTGIIMQNYYTRGSIDSYRKVCLYLKMLLIVSAVAFMVFQVENYRRKKGKKPFSDFSRWCIQHKLPDNTVIANLAWSDFPQLYYSCPQYRYFSGLDPMFSYAVVPETVRRLENFRLGQEDISTADLRQLLGTDYIFLSRLYRRYAKMMMRKSRIAVLYDGEDGWLFRIAPAVEIPEAK